MTHQGRDGCHCQDRVASAVHALLKIDFHPLTSDGRDGCTLDHDRGLLRHGKLIPNVTRCMESCHRGVYGPRLLPWREAVAAAGKGLDVYFFLIGMMLLAKVARKEGLFDWLADQAVQRSGRSAARLFAIVYAVGTVVTVFPSNDATAVVLTPAV